MYSLARIQVWYNFLSYQAVDWCILTLSGMTSETLRTLDMGDIKIKKMSQTASKKTDPSKQIKFQ